MRFPSVAQLISMSARVLDESFYSSAMEELVDDDDMADTRSVLSEFEDDRMRILGHDTRLEDFDGDLEAYNAQLERDMEALRASGRFRMRWNLIPADAYRRALESFMRDGPEAFRFSGEVIRGWLRSVVENLSKLHVTTMLSGHEQYADEDAVRDFFFGDGGGDEVIHDYHSMYDFLDARGFGMWAVLPDGSDAISDYGMKPIANILEALPDEPSPAEMIVALNRCLDVVHCRGDLSSAFIEGGRRTLSAISNE